jgi:hypothetical protein
MEEKGKGKERERKGKGKNRFLISTYTLTAGAVVSDCKRSEAIRSVSDSER